MKFTITRKQSQIGYMFVLTFYCFHIDSSTETIAQYDERHCILLVAIRFKFNISQLVINKLIFLLYCFKIIEIQTCLIIFFIVCVNIYLYFIIQILCIYILFIIRNHS